MAQSQSVWFSPVFAKSVKVFASTYGKFPNLNWSLQLYNNLPLVLLNPLLEKWDMITILLIPVYLAFMVTILLLVFSEIPLTFKQVVQIMILILGTTWLIFISLIRRIIQKNTEFICQINSFFQSNPTTSFQNQNTISERNKICKNLSGTLLLYMVIYMNVIVMPIAGILCYLGVGPMQSIMELIFHLQSNNFMVLVDSIFTFVLTYYILTRETFILAFVGLTLFVRIYAEIVALVSYASSHSQFVFCRYILLRRQYLRIADDFSMVVGYVVVFTQILLCLCLWIALTGWKRFPIFLTLAYLVIFIFGLGTVLFVLQTLSKCRTSSEDLLKKRVSGFHVYGIRGGLHSYLKRMWKCQLPLRINCGKQFVIGKDAIMNYLNVLSSNATNVLVLIKI